MDDLARAESALRAAAIAMVEQENRVRVEDYLTVLASATGVGTLAAAGFDVDGHDLVPGSGLFFEPVNELLTGDPPVAAGSVYAILHSLAPAPVPFTAFPSPVELYAHTARSIGQAGWGKVSVTVPPDHRPWVLPLRVAFDLRPTVADIEAHHGLPIGARHVLTATALRSALLEVHGAMDPAISVHLALQVTFGMAKMAPMTVAALAGLTDSEP